MKFSFAELRAEITQISQHLNNGSNKTYEQVLNETYARILYINGAKTSLLIDLLGLSPKKARAIYKDIFPDQPNNTKRTIVSQNYLCRTTEQKLHVNIFIHAMNFVMKHHANEHSVIAFMMIFHIYQQVIAGNLVVTKPLDINQCHFIFKVQQGRYRLLAKNCIQCTQVFYHVHDELQTTCPVCLKSDTVSCKTCGKEINKDDNEDKGKRPSNYCSDCQRTNKNSIISSSRQAKKGVEDALEIK